jgi:hypothetical protein
MIQVRRFRSRSGRLWFYEAPCPRPNCDHVGLVHATEAEAIRSTEAHVNWWHIALGH